MLRILRDLNLADRAENGEQDDNRKSNSKRNKKDLIDLRPNIHDGLIVDYQKFSQLTQQVLQNANVMGYKKLNSPKWLPAKGN